MTEKVVIVSAARTPIGQMGGYFKDTTAVDLGAVAIQAVIKRAAIETRQVDQVYMGCVLPAGLGQAPARQAALKSGLPITVACTTINKVCGSGLKSIMLAHDTIIANSDNVIVAGGMENMSRAPYLIDKARFGYRLGNGVLYDHMMLDGLQDPAKGESMGYFAEQCAEKFKFSRQQQDEFALRSLELAQQASKQGIFKQEIIAVKVKSKQQTQTLTVDQGPLIVSAEKIPQLKPAFKKEGTVTAANSSSISDGAAACVLMRESFAKQKNIKPLAKIIAHHTFAQEPNAFTTAPIGAISGLMKKLNWTVNDVDLFEINEAFAVVVLATIKALEIPIEKVNIHGGACVLGHPIGASGARLLVTLIYALAQTRKKRGIVSLCLGGGEAVAMAIEML